MNDTFAAAIFDMDGTLLDTMPYWRYTALEYMLARQVQPCPEMLAAMYGHSSRGLIMKYAEKHGLERPDYDEMVRELEVYMNRHYLYDARLKDAALPAFLDMLKRRGVRMCVATGSPRQYARNGLRRLGLLEYFEFVTDNYESAYTKEQPAYFENVAGRMGVDPTDCWVFEDALYAMRSAKAAGMRVCAVEEGTQRADLAEIRACADIYIKSYTELTR